MPTNKPVQRRSFSKFNQPVAIPHLLDVQIDSYNKFLQRDTPPHLRRKLGLQAVFQEIFPILDVHETYSLEFVSYAIGKPRFTIPECRTRNITYGGSLRVRLRLSKFEKIEKKGETVRVPKFILEPEEVYLGEMPLITEHGTFIVNGSERVIVSQLHRSPGVFFDEEIHTSGKKLFSARIIPFRGSWVEFKYDVNDCLYVYIDSRRKIPVTTIFRALGHESNADILAMFYKPQEFKLRQQREKIIGTYCGEPIINPDTGEMLCEAGELLTEAHYEAFAKYPKLLKIKCIVPGNEPGWSTILQTLHKDTTHDVAEAQAKIYSVMRPGEPVTAENASQIMERLFFNSKRYDLGEVGRFKINQRLTLDIPLENTVLDQQDFVSIVNYLIDLRNGRPDCDIDDIDHLGSRRARAVGELLENQFRIGLARMSRTIRERMRLGAIDEALKTDAEREAEIAANPNAKHAAVPGVRQRLRARRSVVAELVNARTVSAVINTFFGSSQLSQFMDQHNPLAELTHKRRLSALGPGGLSRERAGFEVRDVHHTHYGRICPIETPEGPNIGLIASLSTYARINQYGFIESPYRRVVRGRVTNQIDYLTADQEDAFTVAQASMDVDSTGLLEEQIIKCRRRGDFPLVSPQEVDYMDLSPNQLVSVAASLIPFLEHDDANRALMGSNMQRQAVPLLVPEIPIIGTGMEGKAALDSGAVVVARQAGMVMQADSSHIVIRPDAASSSDFYTIVEDDSYVFEKFHLSNQNTCINQRPTIYPGQHVDKGEPIADGASTNRGELALGKNVLVAFMPWWGYNFEDAIIISERLVAEDTFTSLHIEEFELQVRETKRGPEEITREIPNVSEEAIANLDENGIIRVGAEVDAGDYLVGKVTPKGETELTPEERLLRAIFGDKAGDVKDVSLKAPPGMKGVVIQTVLLQRKQNTEESKNAEKHDIEAVKTNSDQRIVDIKRMRDEKVTSLLSGKKAEELRDHREQKLMVKAGTALTEAVLSKLSFDELALDTDYTTDRATNTLVTNILRQAEELIHDQQEFCVIEIDKIQRGEDLPPGVLQLVKVRIGTKRKLSVGDKMAGRHGNKGIVSRIVPVEDLPYLADGTPVDIILNPLGVPSRMNVGQILETHLGWAAKLLGYHVATPVFDGADLAEIKFEMKRADIQSSGKVTLQDGKTGEPFDHEVTVGIIYMLKLAHLADDKIHARSIGPYSLVTQQPLGGKAQFGGQRFGEMEVWALEAYGAAYCLQEMLTVKSDDVTGRSKVYEAIVRGENPPEPGVPESFNVLVKELQSLCLDVELHES